jgi:hypothetical protein
MRAAIIIALLCAVGLASCSHDKPEWLDTTGAGRTAYHLDYEQCFRAADFPPRKTQVAEEYLNDAIISLRNCMTRRGWTLA